MSAFVIVLLMLLCSIIGGLFVFWSIKGDGGDEDIAMKSWNKDVYEKEYKTDERCCPFCGVDSSRVTEFIGQSRFGPYMVFCHNCGNAFPYDWKGILEFGTEQKRKEAVHNFSGSILSNKNDFDHLHSNDPRDIMLPGDNVNHPNHYTQGSIETIDYIKDKLTDEEFRGFIKGNILKYISRERLKNSDEDLRKSNWYLNKLVEALEE